jgi:hypothetical protein
VQAGLDYLRTRQVYTPSAHLFASLLWHSWEETDWNSDLSAKAGMHFRSPYTEKRAIQIFAEYYHGNLPFGQFYQLRSEYFGGGINISF